MAEKAMATHPPGIVVAIVGTLMGDRGRSCEEHTVCGSVLEEDMVVRIRKVQVFLTVKRIKCPDNPCNPVENEGMQFRARYRHETIKGRFKTWEIL